MDTLQTLTSQLARDITGQTELLIRYQHGMASPAFNHQDVKAEYRSVTLQGNRLKIGALYGRPLNDDEIDALVGMTQIFEADQFWLQYATKYDLHESYTNTDPTILCWPAPTILEGKTPAQQDKEFMQKFFE